MKLHFAQHAWASPSEVRSELSRASEELPSRAGGPRVEATNDVKESVAIGIGHHRIGPGRPDQFLEGLPVELGGSNVDRRLAIDITYEGAGIAVLKQGIDHKGVTAKDGHIERQLRSAIDLRSLLLHDHVQDAEVEVARVL